MTLMDKQYVTAIARQLIYQLQDCDDEEFVDLVVKCVRNCDFMPLQVERL